MNSPSNSDIDAGKGAVESSRPEEDRDTNVAPLESQLDHRFQDAMNKSNDSGLAEAGQTAEFSMEAHGENELKKDTGKLPDKSPDSEVEDDQDPGQTQRRNQGQDKEDPLAA